MCKQPPLVRKPFSFGKIQQGYDLSPGISARWKTRDRGPGVRGPGVRGPGVWKTPGLVENAGSGGKRGVRGKRGVWWKTRGLVENAGSGGKRGVWWKTRGLSEKHGVQLFFA